MNRTDHNVISFGPDKVYTRHSEGAFLRLKDGQILFVYSRFSGSYDDDAPSDLVAIRSADEGKSFYKHVECSLPDRAGYYVLNKVPKTESVWRA